VGCVPSKDKHTAIALLIELAIQRGLLSDILSVIILLLEIQEGSGRGRDNRGLRRNGLSALVCSLKRFERIGSSITIDEDGWNDGIEDLGDNYIVSFVLFFSSTHYNNIKSMFF
jgi:hypothetical protein